MNIPILTNRLMLRPLALSDLPDLREIMQDKDAMTAYERIFTDEQITDWINRQISHFNKYGYSLFAVVLRENNEVIGQCGLVHQNEGGEEFTEIGYLFKRRYWHNGYATEAACACRDYAFDILKLDRVCSIIKHNNYPSQNVAKRTGMAVAREINYGAKLKDTLHYLYEIKNQSL